MRYGNAFMRFARAGLPIIDDPVLNEYIDDLGQRLLTNADGVRFPFTFFLINDPSINAAAFLGGRVKVHTGLFLYADSESELASVLAHEITHVTQRHIARYMEAQASSSANGGSCVPRTNRSKNSPSGAPATVSASRSTPSSGTPTPARP